jgi:adenine-specific DNA-methyltransferase
MQNFFEELENLLVEDERLYSGDELLKNKIVELALKMDENLIKLLMSNNNFREHFFIDIEGILVFDKDKFISFVSNKKFLPDSYTKFKNRIGLTIGEEEFISRKKDVVLTWPYKDCYLEGGQTKEDVKRNEIFLNETLAPDQIDRLLDPKVLTNFKKIDERGEHDLNEITDEDNLIIKGNNLIALYTLKKQFLGKIKLIYIDPPYNTGNDTFGYNDSFNHSTWLTFMKNRLEVARELLRDDGAIFVQIDYHELPYLNILLNEIFGRKNFVQLISIKTASPAGFKTVNPGPIDVTEYILFYTKNKKSFNFKKSYVAVDYDENYDKVIMNLDDSPEDWVLKPLRDVVYLENDIEIGGTPQQSAKNAEKKWGKYWKIIRRQIMADYAINHADSVVSIRDPHKPTDKLKILLKLSKKERNKIFIYHKSNDKKGYVINGGALSFYSNKVKNIDGKITSTELLTDLWTDISWDGIANEGQVKLKNGKKPEKLIKRIIELTTDDEYDIVLDFHLGSGTTTAVANKLGRRYIGIEQLDYGENDSLIRLKNVINGEQTGISNVVGWEGGGDFVYCELMKLNEYFVELIQNTNSKEDLNELWNSMEDNAFLNYKIDVNQFNKNDKAFKQLELEDQKNFLFEVLDKNQLYVNLSEIDDIDYKISEQDKRLNKMFYKGII